MLNPKYQQATACYCADRRGVRGSSKGFDVGGVGCLSVAILPTDARGEASNLTCLDFVRSCAAAGNTGRASDSSKEGHCLVESCAIIPKNDLEVAVF